VHIFVERKNYKGVFLPGYIPWEPTYRPASIGLQYVDHMVGNVGWGEMNKWVDFYAKVMGFSQLVSFDDKDISTEYTALDEQSDEQWQWPDQIPDQRTG
jgi:4-hydroxyphenylpyruvate dioxygenase